MNYSEIARIIRGVKGVCPAQRIDAEDDTLELWHTVLADVSFEDAWAGLKVCAAELDFITPRALAAAVKQTRRDRLAAVNVSAGEIAERVAVEGDLHEVAETRYVRAAVADGRLDVAGYRAYLERGVPVTSPPQALPAGPSRRLVGGGGSGLRGMPEGWADLLKRP